MVKHSPKMTALVVSAIRNLREVQGSTPREILNYITAEYNTTNSVNDTTVKRKLYTALKRGLEYGILKEVHGHYSLNTDPETINPTEEMMGPMERRGRGGCKGMVKRKRRRRASGKKGCKGGGRGRRGRRRRGGGGGGKSRRGRKRRSKGGCKPRRARSRRGKSRKCGGGGGGKRRRGARRSRRRSRRGKSCADRRGDEIDSLSKDPIDSSRHRENPASGGYAYEREERRSQSRGRQSVGSRSRSPSHSRSSGSSDREENVGNRRDRQVE